MITVGYMTSYLVPHLRHGLAAGLALFAPLGAHQEVVLVAVPAVLAVEAVCQGLSFISLIKHHILHVQDLTFQVEDIETVLVVRLVPPGVPLVVREHLVASVLLIQVAGVHLLQHSEVLIFTCKHFNDTYFVGTNTLIKKSNDKCLSFHRSRQPLKADFVSNFQLATDQTVCSLYFQGKVDK